MLIVARKVSILAAHYTWYPDSYIVSNEIAKWFSHLLLARKKHQVWYYGNNRKDFPPNPFYYVQYSKLWGE